MTTTDETPPCDCCHAEDGTWTTVPLTVDAMSRPGLGGCTVRLLTHARGVDGRLHLTVVAQGVFEAGHTSGGEVDGVALMPDPEAPGMRPEWRGTAEGALQRRREAVARGDEDPPREWWGPLVAGRHMLQVAR